MSSHFSSPCVTSRRTAAAGLLAVALVRPARAAAQGTFERESLQQAILGFTGGVAPTRGRVTLDIPPLVENGNTVPVTIAVESPPGEAAQVRGIALFNEKNPQPNVITARFGPGARLGARLNPGHAMLATRIRLATSQTLVAVAAMSDGTYWSDSAEVIVTLAACVEF
ncbi:MAG: SoxY-related arm protein [Belnapia sp.]|nr:SoxY-related arm protein [Belnapia sp.]